jgi:hypothetical protein
MRVDIDHPLLVSVLVSSFGEMAGLLREAGLGLGFGSTNLLFFPLSLGFCFQILFFFNIYKLNTRRCKNFSCEVK